MQKNIFYNRGFYCGVVMDDVDGAVKELVKVLLEKNVISPDDVKKIRQRYRSSPKFSTADPI